MRRMTPNTEFARMLAAAELLSAERALVFTYDRDGWRVHPAAIYDPFDAAPLADADVQAVGKSRKRGWPDEWLKPCGSRAAYQRHKTRHETPCAPCIAANRDYERDKKRQKYAAERARRAQSVNISGVIHAPQVSPQVSTQAGYTPVLTTPSGAPMLISVAGQGESGDRKTAVPDTSDGAPSVGADIDADAVTESEAS